MKSRKLVTKTPKSVTVYRDDNIRIKVGRALSTYKPKEITMRDNGLVVVQVINGTNFFYPRTSQLCRILDEVYDLEDRRFPDRGRKKTWSFVRNSYLHGSVETFPEIEDFEVIR